MNTVKTWAARNNVTGEIKVFGPFLYACDFVDNMNKKTPAQYSTVFIDSEHSQWTR